MSTASSSLEGSIRELGLHEVCQLLGATRKSGVLSIRAPLQGAAAEIVFQHGGVTDAVTWPADSTASSAARSTTTRSATNARDLEERVLDLLTWADGVFRFAAIDAAAATGIGVRLAIEPLLVEAAQRAEMWERVADRVPSARAIPAFVDVDTTRLPQLRLAPQEWEVLTRVDGQRDIAALAAVLGRELLEIVGLVHGLIGTGLLMIKQDGAAPRRHATPPSNAAIQDVDDADLWIPGNDSDAIFDPVRTRVVTPDGLPRMRTPAMSFPSHDSRIDTVASHAHRPSSMREADATLLSATDPELLCREGDDAARRGDLPGAYTLWESSLRLNALGGGGAGVNVQRVREVMSLAARLHALLQPAQSDALEN
jgi:hypothetical protein